MLTNTRVPFSLMSCLLALCMLVAPPALAQGKIHPFTQQMWDQWNAKLDVSEAASKPGGSPEAALPVLEAGEEWFKEKRQTLERHPDYKNNLTRQMLLRIKQTKITALGALVFADSAVKTKNTDLIDGKGGAYDQLKRADALVGSLTEILGEQDAIKNLAAYVEQVRGKVQEKAASITSAGGIKLVLPADTKLHPHTKQTFDSWVTGIEGDIGILAGSTSNTNKIRELEGNRQYFMSNHQELVKHPSYAQGVAKFNALMLGLAELKAQRAVELAEEGLKQMNSNYFSESSGTYQQLKDAEMLLKEYGGADADKANAAIASAKAAVEKASDEYSVKSAAAFRLPADSYRGGDKDKLRSQVQAQWKKNYPGDQVLGLRFTKGDWERRKESNYNNGSWYHYDNSVLVLYVVIKKSAVLATVYPVYVNKNNQTGAITIGAETKGGAYSHQDMLIKNVSL